MQRLTRINPVVIDGRLFLLVENKIRNSMSYEMCLKHIYTTVSNLGFYYKFVLDFLPSVLILNVKDICLNSVWVGLIIVD